MMTGPGVLSWTNKDQNDRNQVVRMLAIRGDYSSTSLSYHGVVCLSSV